MLKKAVLSEKVP